MIVNELGVKCASHNDQHKWFITKIRRTFIILQICWTTELPYSFLVRHKSCWQSMQKDLFWQGVNQQFQQLNVHIYKFRPSIVVVFTLWNICTHEILSICSCGCQYESQYRSSHLPFQTYRFWCWNLWNCKHAWLNAFFPKHMLQCRQKYSAGCPCLSISWCTMHHANFIRSRPWHEHSILSVYPQSTKIYTSYFVEP